MERFFNTAGPQKPEICYTIDPQSRIELDEVMTLIHQQRYFVLHAPRQTGKTSCMLALRDYLNKEGDYIALRPQPGEAVGRAYLAQAIRISGPHDYRVGDVT